MRLRASSRSPTRAVNRGAHLRWVPVCHVFDCGLAWVGAAEVSMRGERVVGYSLTSVMCAKGACAAALMQELL